MIGASEYRRARTLTGWIEHDAEDIDALLAKRQGSTARILDQVQRIVL